MDKAKKKEKRRRMIVRCPDTEFQFPASVVCEIRIHPKPDQVDVKHNRISFGIPSENADNRDDCHWLFTNEGKTLITSYLIVGLTISGKTIGQL